MDSPNRPPDVPPGALRVKITVEDFLGEKQVFESWNPPKMKEGDCILIRSDFGTVRIPWGEVKRVTYAAIMPNL